MQAHALTILMRYPELLQHIDDQLEQAELNCVNNDDFSSTYRLIWSAWLELGQHPELEMEDLLPPDILEQIYDWIASALPELSHDQLQRDVMRTILRLREKQLREILQKTQSLVAEAQVDGDLKATRYADTLQELYEALRRVQLALAQ